MSSTIAAYQLINNNLTRWQTMTQAQPEVKIATDYYKKNIESAKTVDDFLKNDRLYRYAMKAFGMDDLIFAKGMMRKVLQGGVADSSSFANKLADPRFAAFAKAFNFASLGTLATTMASASTDVVSSYVQQTVEITAGQKNDGVRLALYFKRNAPNISTAYNILADKALLTVVQTALGISPNSSLQDIATQAKTISAKLNIADLQDPAKLQKFITRFAAMYDINNSSSQPAAPVVQLIAAQGSSRGISTDLYVSIQSLKRPG